MAGHHQLTQGVTLPWSADAVLLQGPAEETLRQQKSQWSTKGLTQGAPILASEREAPKHQVRASLAARVVRSAALDRYIPESRALSSVLASSLG